MIDSGHLDTLFRQFLAGDVSAETLTSTKQTTTVEDVATLMEFVAALDDPGAYCADDHDEKTPAGYFLFIDFVCALILTLGEDAVRRARNFEDTATQPYVKWVVKYVSDSRFHDEILGKFREALAP